MSNSKFSKILFFTILCHKIAGAILENQLTLNISEIEIDKIIIFFLIISSLIKFYTKKLIIMDCTGLIRLVLNIMNIHNVDSRV